ncbi:MAG: hypothetical protein JWQ96_2494 [Segetibacter sp.]|nr:hypothetical protein [Segetibacter sp.]
MKKLLVSLICVLSCYCVSAQADTPRASLDTLPIRALKDSLPAISIIDTAKVLRDSIARIPKRGYYPDSAYQKFLNNPFLQIKEKPVYLIIKPRLREENDEMFYLMAGLLLFLAFIKLVFSRYFNNIFRLFFQPQFRQKQTREQLAQSGLPAFLLNLFFIFSSSCYIALLINNFTIIDKSFWWIYLYSTVILLILYAGKFLLLLFAGWVFNVKEAIETYIFIVYLINKILGVLLVPFILLIAFSRPQLVSAAITLSFILVLLLFLYRYIVSYGLVRRDTRVNPLHFLLYVLAFEVTPLLLIYKALVHYLDISL